MNYSEKDLINSIDGYVQGQVSQGDFSDSVLVAKN